MNQAPIPKIVLEEDFQVRSKLQDDKSSQLLSEWGNSPTHGSKNKKGIHGVPVLRLYGKKIKSRENSIDNLQHDEYMRLQTDGSEKNNIVQHGLTEDVRLRDSNNDNTLIDSTTL